MGRESPLVYTPFCPEGLEPLHSLTYMFQREDWTLAIAQAKGIEPLVLEQPLFKLRAARPKSSESKQETLNFSQERY
jgi:hypothetical protein